MMGNFLFIFIYLFIYYFLTVIIITYMFTTLIKYKIQLYGGGDILERAAVALALRFNWP